jgi:hypothetical protein
MRKVERFLAEKTVYPIWQGVRERLETKELLVER